MKTVLGKILVCALGLSIISATAQSTWNYTISDAGSGNSLVTWNVTGTLTSTPGAILILGESIQPITIAASGIFNDSYAGTGPVQTLPTPDGSYFALGGSDVYYPLVEYAATNAPGGGRDTFSLFSPISPPLRSGVSLMYIPRTQSVIVPIPFSDFNPGTYSTQQFGFTTPLTVNLTVVPELSTLALLSLTIAGIVLKRTKP